MKEENYIEINRSAYDTLATEYKTKYKFDAGANKFYNILKNIILNKKNNKNIKMLEIGPGVGTLMKMFEDNDFRTTAVELSKNMSEICSKTSPNTVVINQNILEVNFMPKQFDFILAMAVIHNFPEKDLILLLSKIKVWLKDSGYFIIDTTNNNVTETGYFEKDDYNNKVVRYRRKWKKEDLEKFMTQEGFIIEDRIDYVYVTSNKEWLIYSFKIKKEHI